jgi:hypothetical protein
LFACSFAQHNRIDDDDDDDDDDDGDDENQLFQDKWKFSRINIFVNLRSTFKRVGKEIVFNILISNKSY